MEGAVGQFDAKHHHEAIVSAESPARPMQATIKRRASAGVIGWAVHFLHLLQLNQPTLNSIRFFSATTEAEMQSIQWNVSAG